MEDLEPQTGSEESEPPARTPNNPRIDLPTQREQRPRESNKSNGGGAAAAAPAAGAAVAVADGELQYEHE